MTGPTPLSSTSDLGQEVYLFPGALDSSAGRRRCGFLYALVITSIRRRSLWSVSSAVEIDLGRSARIAPVSRRRGCGRGVLVRASGGMAKSDRGARRAASDFDEPTRDQPEDEPRERSRTREDFGSQRPKRSLTSRPAFGRFLDNDGPQPRYPPGDSRKQYGRAGNPLRGRGRYGRARYSMNSPNAAPCRLRGLQKLV